MPESLEPSEKRLTSARSPADAFSLDPSTMAVTRWTESETGGLDVTKNVEPELVKVKSFDGLEVSGFLYRPDPAKFPGKLHRPRRDTGVTVRQKRPEVPFRVHAPQRRAARQRRAPAPPP